MSSLLDALIGGKTRFDFEIDGELMDFGVVAFHGSEGMSELFRFELDLISSNPDVLFADVLGKGALLTLHGDPTDRVIHGMVARFAQLEETVRFARYRAVLVPKCFKLSYRRDCRIFQELDVSEIITEVLQGAGIPADEFSFDLFGAHPKREYCVQYRESDWAFVSRLLEEEGIFYYFRHTEEGHTLVMSDNPFGLHPISAPEEVPYGDSRGFIAPEDHIASFGYAEQIRTGKVSLQDYDFERPALSLMSNEAAAFDPDLEVYDYPGRYFEPGIGKSLAKTRMQAAQSTRAIGQGESGCVRLTPGFFFDMVGHPRSLMNRRFLVTRVVHKGRDEAVLPEVTRGTSISTYDGQFACVPDDVPFHPVEVTPKPRIHGIQTAIVVGPAGEEIYTDQHGRVKVQFHWDREGARDEKSSCWIRVSQSWAGEAWGGMLIPRIDQEVVVSFLEGNPDRPLITGRVYHGTNVPPYELPANKTKSTLKSNSSLGGGGYNEILFDDIKDNEFFYVQAQKNLHKLVKNDEEKQVGRNQTLQVCKDRDIHVDGIKRETVRRSVHYTIGGSESTFVGNNRSLIVKKEDHQKVGKIYTMEAGDEIHFKSGKLVVWEAGEDLTIAGPGGFIRIDSKGVTIVGNKVLINSGGSPGSGTKAKPKPPAPAKKAKIKTPK